MEVREAGRGFFQLSTVTSEARVPFRGNKIELAKKSTNLPSREVDKRIERR